MSEGKEGVFFKGGRSNPGEESSATNEYANDMVMSPTEGTPSADQDKQGALLYRSYSKRSFVGTLMAGFSPLINSCRRKNSSESSETTLSELCINRGRVNSSEMVRSYTIFERVLSGKDYYSNICDSGKDVSSGNEFLVYKLMYMSSDKGVAEDIWGPLVYKMAGGVKDDSFPEDISLRLDLRRIIVDCGREPYEEGYKNYDEARKLVIKGLGNVKNQNVNQEEFECALFKVLEHTWVSRKRALGNINNIVGCFFGGRGKLEVSGAHGGNNNERPSFIEDDSEVWRDQKSLVE